MPTLCIGGDQDGTTPPDIVRSMAELIRNSEFRIIADAGHIPCIEQPEAVAGSDRRFLARAPTAEPDTIHFARLSSGSQLFDIGLRRALRPYTRFLELSVGS